MYSADIRQTDVQLLKWRQDYQETMNCWKQYDHVMGILLEPVKKPRKTFLQKFYEGMYVFGRNIDFHTHLAFAGKDEEAVVPAASGVV